jgi:uncharacterized membrane protein
MSAENVIAVSFDQNSAAYEAFTNLKELADQGQMSLSAAAIVERGEDGRIVTKDQVGDGQLEGTATGGVIGLLVGILGGPFGVLIGGATGLLIGSLYDLDDAEDTQSVLAEISQAVRPGQTVVLAEVTEQSDEVVDQAMGKLGGRVLRRPVADVEAEIAAAEKAQRAAKREARKQLMESRKAHLRDEIRARVEALKEKLAELREKESERLKTLVGR